MGVRDRISKGAAAPEGAMPFRRPSGRASYPRRITLDLDEKRYQWLRKVAYEGHVPAAAILRAAMDALAADPTHLAPVIAAAQQEYPAP
jgi:hypothetical protein